MVLVEGKNYFLLHVPGGAYEYYIEARLKSLKDITLEQVVSRYMGGGRFEMTLVHINQPQGVFYDMQKGPDFLKSLLLLQEFNNFNKISISLGGNFKKGMVDVLEDIVTVCNLDILCPSYEETEDITRKFIQQSYIVRLPKQKNNSVSTPTHK